VYRTSLPSVRVPFETTDLSPKLTTIDDIAELRFSEMSVSDFELLVIGSGPAGQKGAIAAAKAGKRVALVDRTVMMGGVSIMPRVATGNTMAPWVIIGRAFRRGVAKRLQVGDIRDVAHSSHLKDSPKLFDTRTLHSQFRPPTETRHPARPLGSRD
jgi:alkyl hydroperoxide reductase subunit AhpF